MANKWLAVRKYHFPSLMPVSPSLLAQAVHAHQFELRLGVHNKRLAFVIGEIHFAIGRYRGR